MENSLQKIENAFAEQARLCKIYGSEFTAFLLSNVLSVLDTSSETGRKIRSWAGDPSPSGDALALRLAGALHSIAKRGSCPELTSVYPPETCSDVSKLAAAVEKAVAQDDSWIAKMLNSPPQTNEVGRSAVLFTGLIEISNRTKLPISLFEIGASAGLNLYLDRYSYQLGNLRLGCRDSRVKLSPDWTGNCPIGEPVIVERSGCDLSPIDLSNETERERLFSYVWPDQSERYDRLKNASEIALSEGLVEIEKADAVDWVDRNIRPDRGKSHVTVLMHSLTYCYLERSSKEKITRHMEKVGDTATHDDPLAWLAYEFNAQKQIDCSLRIWPSGDRLVLAVTDAHGKNVHWLA
ncbi:MAG: DUF2332 family protein [Rhodobacteraceae bacterium]|nr:DUF2332 family protein [Paracoccaceae bacterium]